MTAKQVISQVEDLPVLSETAHKLPGLLANPHLHSEDLVSVLRCDTALTAKLLHICNSAHHGLREPVTSVDQAVLLLGHNTIVRMVCALCYGGLMDAPLEGYAVESRGLWSHSLATAFAAESVAMNDFHGGVHSSTAFTAGLLHDLGKLILNQVLTADAQARIRARISEDGLSRPEAEKEVLGTDHSEVGAELLQSWKLPETIVEAVANHHHPVTKPAVKLSSVVHLANSLVHLIGSATGWEDHAIRIDKGLVKSLGLAERPLQLVLLRVYSLMPQVEEWMAN